MNCLVCDSQGKKIFKGEIMNKYNIQYYQCLHCGLVYTEKPFWIEEAYSDSITGFDTGIMQRNLENTIITNEIIIKFFNKKGRFLDYGGGYGIFVRMMRDLGYDFYWTDKYSLNLLARGFEYNGQGVDIVTAFELFEHFDKPMEEIKQLLNYSHTILFSTLLYDDSTNYQDFSTWWYYVPQTGQHIVFYSKKTMEYIAKKYNLNYYKISDELHLLTDHDINEKKLKLCLKSKYGKICQYYHWILNKRQPWSKKDMDIIQERKLM